MKGDTTQTQNEVFELHRPKHLLHCVKTSLHTWGDETAGKKQLEFHVFLVSEKIFQLTWVHIYSPKVYSNYYLSAAAGVNILYGLVDVIGRLEGD